VFRTLIVDDEPIARRMLRDELAAYNEIEIVTEAEDGVSAAGLIEKLTPDLSFLDLQMPRMGGGCNPGGAEHGRNNRRRDCVQGWSFERSRLRGGGVSSEAGESNLPERDLAGVGRQWELQCAAKDISVGPATG